MAGAGRRRMSIPAPPTARSDRSRQAAGSSQRAEVPRAPGSSERQSGSSRRGDGVVIQEEVARVGASERRQPRSESRIRPRSPEEEEEEMVPPLQRRRTGGGPTVVETSAEAIAAAPISSFAPGGDGAAAMSPAETTAVVGEGSSAPTAGEPGPEGRPRLFPRGQLGDILDKVGRAVRPLLKDVSRLRAERAELRKTLDVKLNVINKKRERVQALEAENRGLLSDHESLIKERDLAVMRYSSVERELDELRKKAEDFETRLASAQETIYLSDRQRIQAEGEAAAMKTRYSVLEGKHEELVEALDATRESSRRWMSKYEELKEGEQVNYHGAWNNAILQILRDNPGVALDLSKLNRYDDWVAYTDRDPLEGRDEEWGRDRLVPVEPDAEEDAGGSEAAQGGGSEEGGDGSSPPPDGDDPCPPPNADNPMGPMDAASAAGEAVAAQRGDDPGSQARLDAAGAPSEGAIAGPETVIVD